MQGNYKLHTQIRGSIHPHVTLAAATFVWHVNCVRARHAMMSMDYLMAMATFFLAILMNLMHPGSFVVETWTSKAAAVIFGSTQNGCPLALVLLGTRPLKIWRSSSKMPNQSSWQQKAMFLPLSPRTHTHMKARGNQRRSKKDIYELELAGNSFIPLSKCSAMKQSTVTYSTFGKNK